MAHLSNFFHQQRPRVEDKSSYSAPNSARNSRESSITSSTDTTTYDESRNWFMKQLHQYSSQPSMSKVISNATNPSKSITKQIETSLSSSTHNDTTVDTSTESITGASSTTTTKLHRLNTTNLREYGECYKRLGKGSTAIISICRSSINPTTAKLYAIKQFRKKNKIETEKEYMKKLTSEFCISSTFCHRNIVETIDLVLDDQNRYCTVMEYCPGGDLFSVIISENMTDVEITCCFKQMMEGIAYLHSVGVAHRDIKPENLLLTLDGTLKITDFGVSDVFRCAWEKTKHKSHGLVGSEPYIAPEAFDRDHAYWGSNADIWSAGIVLYSMYRGGHAWIKADKRSDREFRLYLGHYGTTSFPNFKKFPIEIQNILYGMLDPNPETRLTADQVLQQSWTKSILICDEKGLDAMKREHHHTTLAVKKSS